jgi:hypothetical protein
MAVFLDDVKVGYCRQIRTVSETKVTNDIEQTLTLGPGALKITATERVITIETPQGEPVSFRYILNMGAGSNQVATGKIEDGTIHFEEDTGSGPRPRDVPYPQDALMPEGVRLLTAEKGLEEGTQYSYSEFEPTDLAGIGQDVTVGKPEDVALIGRTEKLIVLTTTMHIGRTPVPGLAYVDRQYNGLKAQTSLMGMKLTLVACDEAYARSANGQFDPFKALMPVSPVAIENPRRVRAASYTVAAVDANRPLVVPSLDGQNVVAKGDGTLKIDVRLAAPSSAAVRPYSGADAEALAALKPSAYVESDTPEILAQAGQIVGTQEDALAAAQAIEEWTGRHITGKVLGVGYASAVTTLHSGQGDCTEHAVLTAALCRAAGIPCRLVLGIAYTEKFNDLENRFIGHAWNQAFIGGQWVTLDAALGADAARIALLAGADDPASFIGLLESLGNIRIVDVKVGSGAAQ